jgi:DNA invertase Pin-like site-specific DNA recombinase
MWAWRPQLIQQRTYWTGPSFALTVAQIDKDDVLMVTRLDRLARSTRDLLNMLAAITDKGAGFRSLGDTWADTTTAHGRLMLTVLGGLAEFERELIRARTSEGRERAKANGVKMGPKFKLTVHQKREAIKRRDHGKETQGFTTSGMIAISMAGDCSEFA